MRQIVLDTETTGLSAEGGDRIVDIGCVELVGRKRSGNNRHYYLNPGRDSEPGALQVHGLTTEFLSDKPPFAAIADELLEYLAGAELIIHNAPFDVGFLNKELELAGRVPLKNCVGSVTDTLLMAKEQFPGKRNSLDGLCQRLGVDNSGRKVHGALRDAELLADVYIQMTRGQDALLIDTVAESAVHGARQAIDLAAFHLPVLTPSAAELEAHAAALKDIGKASGGKTVWPVETESQAVLAVP
ncbi:MAG: DNA polymerase III subunit epsilon [Burkholderiaceae bacterium]